MDLFWKAAAGVLVTLLLNLALGKQEKDIATGLSLLGCIAVMGIALVYLEPVLEFLGELQELGQLQPEMAAVLMKILGVGLVSQIAGTVCADGGNAALGKTVELLGGMVILYLSLPVFTALMELVRSILEEL